MPGAKKSKSTKPRLVGMNHVALEVGDIEEALAFYGAIFDFGLRSKSKTQAFIDMGDQFIALMKVAEPHKDRHRHFAVVVDDRSRVKELIELAGGTFAAGPFLDFFDPWGNRVEVVEYTNIQFTKASHVLRGMGLDLAKNDKALAELAEKGMAPDKPGKTTKSGAKTAKN
jgi:catechol 2,3-dioxygenase-like lactoylglutathione lyase family enzyme